MRWAGAGGAPLFEEGRGADQADVKSREVYGKRRFRGLRRRSRGFVRANPHCEGAEDAAGAA